LEEALDALREIVMRFGDASEPALIEVVARASKALTILTAE
jgi:hypothetical protein